MAKLAFFAAVVALVALSAAEGYTTLQQHCQRQLQESSLDACQQVVDHQLSIQLPFFHPRSSQLRTGMRVQCCQQLQDISRECRAAAIRRIVRQYEYQAMVPLREDPYYPGEDEEEQEGGSYYPSETYPQQEQGWEQEQQQHQQGWYRPSQTYRQPQEQGSYRPSQTYRPRQQRQGSYRPSQTFPQQQQGSYYPSQSSPQQQGSYYPSETFPQQQQGEGSFGESTTQQQMGGQEPHRLRITIYRPARQPAQHELGEITWQQEGQGQYCGRQSQQTGYGGFSSPPRFGTEQQAARLRVVARARQVAAQLPAMCRLEGSTFSGSQY